MQLSDSVKARGAWGDRPCRNPPLWEQWQVPVTCPCPWCTAPGPEADRCSVCSDLTKGFLLFRLRNVRIMASSLVRTDWSCHQFSLNQTHWQYSCPPGRTELRCWDFLNETQTNSTNTLTRFTLEFSFSIPKAGAAHHLTILSLPVPLLPNLVVNSIVVAPLWRRQRNKNQDYSTCSRRKTTWHCLRKGRKKNLLSSSESQGGNGFSSCNF